jgi:hypothetical protein
VQPTELRDYFAAAALIGFTGTIRAGDVMMMPPPDLAKNSASLAYLFADAMLAERAREKEKPPHEAK